MSTFVPSAGGDSELGPTSAAGGWCELPADRLRATLRACSCCGRPVFGRVWRAEVDGAARDFCEARCEALFTRYLVPRHGRSAHVQG